MIETTETPSHWSLLTADAEIGHLLLNARHRMAHGLQAVAHRDGVAIVGGTATEMFGGYGVRKALAQVLPLLDGTRTLNQIEQACGDFDSAQIREIVGTLFMSGMLRTGDATALDTGISKFLDRFVGSTGGYRTGAEAADRLHRSSLAVHAPERISTRMTALFDELGGGSTTVISDAESLGAVHDLLLVVTVPDDNPVRDIFARAGQLGIPTLNIELAGRNARIGPLVVPRFSASYECYLSAHAPLGKVDDGLDRWSELFWTGATLQMAFAIITKTLKRPAINAFTDHIWAEGRHSERRTGIARLHGWDAGGNLVPLGLDSTTPGYEGWKQYCTLALQSRAWHPANAHLQHYKSENILSIFERSPTVATGRTLRLNPDTTVRALPGCVSADQLAILISQLCGFQLRESGQRRLVPTGGALGSSLVLLLVRDVQGLPSGSYWYDGHTERLERMKDIDIAQAFEELGIGKSERAAMISFGNVLKTSRKYGAFGINVGWYDAGVLLAYARQLSDALGLVLIDHPRPAPESLMERLGLPETALMPTGVMSLSSANSPCTDRLPDLVRRIAARRATREWPTGEVTAEEIAKLSTLIDAALERHRDIAGIQLPMAILALLKRSDADGGDGFYSYRPSQGLRLIRSYPRHLHAGILSQERLCEAPVILLPLINLGGVFELSGEPGMETAYRAAGTLVGDIWLESARIDWTGTACGGAFEGAIRNATGQHGLDAFSPLALCLGPAAGRPSSSVNA